MTAYDFDPQVQTVFFGQYSHIPSTDWKQWLVISSREEYESQAVALSGLSLIDDLFDRIHSEKTDPSSFSITAESLATSKGPLLVCHTSGTSGGSISDVKWFHMSKELVEHLWAPGMQAIFEASGLTPQTDAVIFVPSRARTDGLSFVEGNPVIKLYSAEFSQRLMLSMIKPRSYLLYQYKDARSITVLAEMLSMDRISVVSAPFLTVLGWADLKKLRKGLEKSCSALDSGKEEEGNPEVNNFKKKINRLGLKAAASEIQKQLAALLSDATLIFSATAMTEQEWKTICNFLHWEKGEEKVTNLYVGSEVGPFAASIGPHSWNTMDVFPLTVPVLEHKGERYLLSRSPYTTGNLLLSRMHNRKPLINIDTGDVITVTNQEGLPVIAGEILRAGFPLKTRVTFSPELHVREPYSVFVGSYFNLDGIHIKNPRLLVTCLAEQCNFDKKSSLVLKKDIKWFLIVPFQDKNCSHAVQNRLSLCPHGSQLEQAIKKGVIGIKTVKENPVKSAIPRSELITQVRKGELPKGVLVRWPLYVVVPAESEVEFV